MGASISFRDYQWTRVLGTRQESAGGAMELSYKTGEEWERRVRLIYSEAAENVRFDISEFRVTEVITGVVAVITITALIAIIAVTPITRVPVIHVAPRYQQIYRSPQFPTELVLFPAPILPLLQRANAARKASAYTSNYNPRELPKA